MIPSIQDVLSVKPENFKALALATFQHQYNTIPVYRNYVDALGRVPGEVKELRDIPFLPISFFKSHEVKPEGKEERIFESSRTGGSMTSKRYVMNSAIYEASFITAFRLFYGLPSEFCILALLPNYLDQGNSSLVYMVNHLIQGSRNPPSGFYRENFEEVHSILAKNEENQVPTLLLGVSYALLNFAEKHPMPLKKTILMETGGMKGRHKELTKSDLHKRLKKAFGQDQIHAEYGMTEMYSQAYSPGSGRYFTPPWMHVMIRETKDPFSFEKRGKTGGLNVIDLANQDSVSFIETQDLARLYPAGDFEIMGRFDSAEVRGCNLMDPLNQ